MTRKEYNGWTNYETWLVNLHMDNSQGDQERWLEVANQAIEHPKQSEVWTQEEAQKFTLADLLKDQMEEELTPKNTESLQCGLILAALSEVDWDNIAESWVQKAKEYAND
jgi:hypothetical protein